MSKQKPTYRIAPPGDRLRIWGADGRALAAEQPGDRPDNEQHGLQGAHRRLRDSRIYTNSFGYQFANTVTASEYKGAQKQKDKSGGYILVRWVANP